MSQDQVVARVKGSSPNEIFPSLVYAVLDLVSCKDVSRETGVSMLTDLIVQTSASDPDGWVEPPPYLAEVPVVFEALQHARIRIM